MKSNSRNAPPLIKGALALAGFFLVIWGGFHLWQWYKLRPLEAALDTFTTDTPIDSISIPPFRIDPQKLPRGTQEKMVQFVKSLRFPMIENQQSGFGGGWQFRYICPQGTVTVSSRIVILDMEDGTRLEASFDHGDWDLYRQLGDEVWLLWKIGML